LAGGNSDSGIQLQLDDSGVSLQLWVVSSGGMAVAVFIRYWILNL
jgi:hypothetical protein